MEIQLNVKIVMFKYFVILYFDVNILSQFGIGHSTVIELEHIF